MTGDDSFAQPICLAKSEGVGAEGCGQGTSRCATGVNWPTNSKTRSPLMRRSRRFMQTCIIQSYKRCVCIQHANRFDRSICLQIIARITFVLDQPILNRVHGKSSTQWVAGDGRVRCWSRRTHRCRRRPRRPLCRQGRLCDSRASRKSATCSTRPSTSMEPRSQQVSQCSIIFLSFSTCMLT